MNEFILLAIVSAVILCCCIPASIFSGESRDRKRRNVINQIAAQLEANEIANQQQEAAVATNEEFSSIENVHNI